MSFAFCPATRIAGNRLDATVASATSSVTNPSTRASM
jgi:hypothetical protein